MKYPVWEISSLAQLHAIRWDPNGDGAASTGKETSYASAFPEAAASMGCPSSGSAGDELTDDLDFDTDAYGNDGAGWEPLPAFSGVLDGGGHTVSNLFISRSVNQVGLFSVLGQGGQARNVGLTGADITTAGSDVGALVGVNGGSVAASYATGAVGGTTQVGGLVGDNAGSVTNSHWDTDTSGQ